jgi:hypothetical protein
MMSAVGNSNNEVTITTPSSLLVSAWRNPTPQTPASDGQLLIRTEINALALMVADPSASNQDGERPLPGFIISPLLLLPVQTPTRYMAGGRFEI